MARPANVTTPGLMRLLQKARPANVTTPGLMRLLTKARPANVTTPGVRRLLQKARPANVTTPGFRNLFCKRLARQMLLLLQKARPTNARPAQNSHMQNCRALKEFPAKCQGYQDLPDRARLLQLFCGMGFFGHRPTWAPAFIGPGPRAGFFCPHTHTREGPALCRWWHCAQEMLHTCSESGPGTLFAKSSFWRIVHPARNGPGPRAGAAYTHTHTHTHKGKPSLH